MPHSEISLTRCSLSFQKQNNISTHARACTPVHTHAHAHVHIHHGREKVGGPVLGTEFKSVYLYIAPLTVGNPRPDPRSAVGRLVQSLFVPLCHVSAPEKA